MSLTCIMLVILKVQVLAAPNVVSYRNVVQLSVDLRSALTTFEKITELQLALRE